MKAWLLLLLAGCADVGSHSHEIYRAESGAALVCNVVAGVIRNCQEAPSVAGNPKVPIIRPEPVSEPEAPHS